MFEPWGAQSAIRRRALEGFMDQGPPNTPRSVAPLIDGTFLDSDSNESIDVINPSTGQRLLSLPVGSEADVHRAVTAARRTFEDGCWRTAPPSFRKRILRCWADLVAANAQELDRLDAEEMGKPISLGLANAASAAASIQFSAESVDKIAGEVYSSDPHSFVTQIWVPRGVVAAVVPWNFPTYNAAAKLGPSLAAGNSVVLKPSELASRSAINLAWLALEAGVPPGVLNVVPGVGKIVGRALGLHTDVDMVTFTGSTSVGKQMLEYSGQSNMKVVLAECGGKSPQILFDDGVNLDVASKAIAQHVCVNQGQVCTVGSRLLVQKTIAEEVLEKVSAELRTIVMGSATDATTTFGPIASAQQCERVMGYIRAAEVDGARLVVGGKQVMRETGGYFVEPTIFNDVQPKSGVAQQEIFGPVLAVIPFELESEAICIANNTIYALAAYVWTSSLSRGMRMAKGVRSTVVINACAPQGEGPGHSASSEPGRQSGIGTESGLAGVESYLRRQLVWINHA
jgi:acyl-CoA reductase-like NAD-dependent aldehyde dehydrogenase